MTEQFGIDKSAQDPSVRPQDDFYQFVNGTWLKNTPIPADKPLYGAFTQLRDKSEQEVHDIITAAAESDSAKGDSATQSKAAGLAKKIGDLYASFMDEERANELGVAPIAAELKLIETARNIDDLTKAMAGGKDLEALTTEIESVRKKK